MALWLFQSTLSVRRATVKDHPMRWLLLFQSTLSVRRATGVPSGDGERDVISIHALRKESDRPVAGSVPMSLRFQSTLSVRRATKASDCPLTPFQISIHALRKESDGVRGFQHFIPLISIHALRKESDAFVTAYAIQLQFQSTLSVRRATCDYINANTTQLFQSTLSVRRATTMVSVEPSPVQFQSTLSVRRATYPERFRRK